MTYEWIPREQNKHADRLANEAMDAGKRGEAWSPAASARRELRRPRTPRRRWRDAPAAPPSHGWSAGTADLGHARPRWCCCGTARRRTRPRSGSAGAGGRTPSCPSAGRRRPRPPPQRSRRGRRRRGRRLAAAAGPADGGGRRRRRSGSGRASRTGFARVRLRRVGGADLRRGPRSAGRTSSAAWLGSTRRSRRPAASPSPTVRRRVAARPRQAAGALPAADRARRHPRDADQDPGADAVGAPLSALYRMELSPASLTEVQWYEGGRRRCAASTTPLTCSSPDPLGRRHTTLSACLVHQRPVQA